MGFQLNVEIDVEANYLDDPVTLSQQLVVM